MITERSKVPDPPESLPTACTSRPPPKAPSTIATIGPTTALRAMTPNRPAPRASGCAYPRPATRRTSGTERTSVVKISERPMRFPAVSEAPRVRRFSPLLPGAVVPRPSERNGRDETRDEEANPGEERTRGLGRRLRHDEPDGRLQPCDGTTASDRAG